MEEATLPSLKEAKLTIHVKDNLSIHEGCHDLILASHDWHEDIIQISSLVFLSHLNLIKPKLDKMQ